VLLQKFILIVIGLALLHIFTWCQLNAVEKQLPVNFFLTFSSLISVVKILQLSHVIPCFW